MIYTLTPNPSLDLLCFCDGFAAGKINRAFRQVVLPGGKGINVSLVLKELGIDSTVLGFEAGFTGQEIRRMLADNGIKEELVHVDNGCSRINVKISSDTETELNGPGPDIDDSAVKALMTRLDHLEKGDILIMSGSIPSSLGSSFCGDVASLLEESGVMFAADIPGKDLGSVIPYHPFAVKPNSDELGEYYGTSIDTREKAAEYALKLRSEGAQNVIVSMGADGAVMASDDGNVYSADALTGDVINTVGAGDSMLAGFVSGISRGMNREDSFRLAVAAGSACAFGEGTAKGAETEALLPHVSVFRLDTSA